MPPSSHVILHPLWTCALWWHEWLANWAKIKTHCIISLCTRNCSFFFFPFNCEMVTPQVQNLRFSFFSIMWGLPLWKLPPTQLLWWLFQCECSNRALSNGPNKSGSLKRRDITSVDIWWCRLLLSLHTVYRDKYTPTVVKPFLNDPPLGQCALPDERAFYISCQPLPLFRSFRWRVTKRKRKRTSTWRLSLCALCTVLPQLLHPKWQHCVKKVRCARARAWFTPPLTVFLQLC